MATFIFHHMDSFIQFTINIWVVSNSFIIINHATMSICIHKSLCACLVTSLRINSEKWNCWMKSYANFERPSYIVPSFLL